MFFANETWKITKIFLKSSKNRYNLYYLH